jgi:glutaminyl-tRNA synthetase
VQAEVRLYDRLFMVPRPGAGERSFLEELNPASVKVVTAYAEPSLRQTLPEDRVQFERQGYFVADRHDHHRDRGTLVFNRVTALKEADRPA